MSLLMHGQRLRPWEIYAILGRKTSMPSMLMDGMQQNVRQKAMEFSDYLPIWNQLTPRQQETVAAKAFYRTVEKGTMLHSVVDCTGLLLIRSGQLRAFILSKEGREVVTRMLRYFQSEGMVKLSRGVVELTDRTKLEILSGA